MLIAAGMLVGGTSKASNRMLHEKNPRDSYIHRGRTYIEGDRMTSSGPMESADQTARAGGRASTTMVVLTRPPAQSV